MCSSKSQWDSISYLLGWLLFKNIKIKDKCWWDCRENGTLIHYLVQPLWKIAWGSLKHWKIGFLNDATISGVSPKEMNIFEYLKGYLQAPHVHCIIIHIVKIWMCTLMFKWIKKQWSYSAFKIRDLPFVTTWVKLENIMLSEHARYRKMTHDLTYMWNLKKLNT